MFNFKNPQFYFVTDSQLTKKDIFDDTKNAIKAGCKIIQYREKYKKEPEIRIEIKQLKKICQGKAFLIINDYVHLAKELNADGAHIGQHDLTTKHARNVLGPDKIIGKSTHTYRQAKTTIKEQVDYISVGPIFKTTTKKRPAKVVGTKLLKRIRRLTKKPICAIGGINKNNIEEVLEFNPNLVAALSATIKTNNVEKEVKDFNKIIKDYKENNK